MVRLNDSKEHPLGFLNCGVLCLSSPPQSLGTLGIGPILAEALRGRRLLRVRSCGQRKDSAQEFLFIFCVAQAVFRPSASSCSVSSLGMLCVCSHAFREGSVVEMLLCWWDGEVGMGCWVTAPSLAGFRPGRLGTPSWALTILLSVWEGGGQSAVVSSLCLLLCGKDGGAVRVPISRGMWFHVPAWQHFLRTLQTRDQAAKAASAGRDSVVTAPWQGAEAGLLLAAVGGVSPNCQSSLGCFCPRPWVTSCSSPHPGK